MQLSLCLWCKKKKYLKLPDKYIEELYPGKNKYRKKNSQEDKDQQSNLAKMWIICILKISENEKTNDY